MFSSQEEEGERKEDNPLITCTTIQSHHLCDIYAFNFKLQSNFMETLDKHKLRNIL